MAGFDNPWYAEIIERFSYLPQNGDEPVERGLLALANAVVAASAIIAQAVDGISERLKDVSDSINAK